MIDRMLTLKPCRSVISLSITAYELAVGEPPHAKLHSMRAAIKIPTSPPPTLPDPGRFSPDFHSFLAAALVKEFARDRGRPSCSSTRSSSRLRDKTF